MPFFDTTADPPRIVLGYVPETEPGLDLDDPRTIRYRDLADGHLGDDGTTDYLTHTSHLRVARSTDGEHFEVEPSPALLPASEPGGLRGGGPTGHRDRRRPSTSPTSR